MIVSEHVQYAVNKQAVNLILQRCAVFRGLAARRFDADDNIPEQPLRIVIPS